MSEAALLAATGLSVRYGRVSGVEDLSFTLAAGEVLALIGANGSGKSSTLKGLMGLEPSSGRIRLGAEDLSALPTPRRVAAGLALSPEGRHVFPEMTVAENLVTGAGPAGPAQREERAARQYAMFPRLAERREQRAGSLSGGEQQMLAIARALMSAPRALLLDEPTLGLAPLVVAELGRTIRALAAQGISVLLAEQNAHMALGAADRALVLVGGRKALEGSAAALARDPEVRRAYLGG
jgi:branched-chain amino acid transport system ATP-binding protein